jgi:hypothetical protein
LLEGMKCRPGRRVRRSAPNDARPGHVEPNRI